MQMKNIADSWNSMLYDQNHSFVSKFGESIVELLAPQVGERVLDLGCGTGDLAKQIADLGSQVIGVDQSDNMITEAKRKYPHIPFKVENARSLSYEREFDAVFSNAALHWIQAPEEVLSSIHKALIPGGRLVAEFGGKDNVKQIIDALLLQFQRNGIEDGANRIPWYFPSIGEYTTLMEETGFHVSFAQHFARPTPLEGKDGLRNWLNMFGDSFFKGLTDRERDQLITDTENHLRPTMFQNGQWLADYKRIRVVGVKE